MLSGDLSVWKNPYPKPSKEAQAKVPGAKLVPFTDGLYTRKEQRPLMPGTEPAGMSKGTADRLLRMNYVARLTGFVLWHIKALVSEHCSTYVSTKHADQPVNRVLAAAERLWNMYCFYCNSR